MHGPNSDLRGLTVSIQKLTETLDRKEKHSQKSRRLLLVVILGLGAALIAVTTVAVTGLPPNASAQVGLPTGAPGLRPDPETRTAMKQKLFEELPPSERIKIMAFEKQVNWLKQYLMTMDEGWEEPTIALMLHRMASSMEVMPDMNRQMEASTQSISAVPVMTAAMQRMSGNMAAMTNSVAVIAGSVDSTADRMGRMMPWMPWSP